MAANARAWGIRYRHEVSPCNGCRVQDCRVRDEAKFEPIDITVSFDGGAEKRE